jgi:hypothetical protein
VKRSFIAVAGMLLFLQLPGAAQPAHTLSQGASSQSAVTPEKFDSEIEASTAPLVKAGAQGERFIQHDIAFPADSGELRRMHGFGLLLISAWSQDAAELPLKSVYLVDRRGGQLPLALLGSVARSVPASSVAGKVYGPNRRDSFYLLPLDKIGSGVQLLGDFARNREGFVIGQDWTPLNYGVPIVSGTLPPRAAVKQMMDREYPGFEIPITAIP